MAVEMPGFGRISSRPLDGDRRLRYGRWSCSWIKIPISRNGKVQCLEKSENMKNLW